MSLNPAKSSTSEAREKKPAAILAASIQEKNDLREIQYSLIALAVKLGLILLGALSLIRLSLAYQERLSQYSELNDVLSVEFSKMIILQRRFDKLFSIGGEQRLLNEQDQWIAPNRLRIIWR